MSRLDRSESIHQPANSLRQVMSCGAPRSARRLGFVAAVVLLRLQKSWFGIDVRIHFLIGGIE